jgi:hypothetical protein
MADNELKIGKCADCGREKPIFFLGECRECFKKNNRCIYCSKPMDGPFDYLNAALSRTNLPTAPKMICFDCVMAGDSALRQLNRYSNRGR